MSSSLKADARKLETERVNFFLCRKVRDGNLVGDGVGVRSGDRVCVRRRGD
jgi:hypothetical protein